MGQHKSNPTAQLAKEGKLPPKKEPLSKREMERRMHDAVEKYLIEKTGLSVDTINQFLNDEGGEAIESQIFKNLKG